MGTIYYDYIKKCWIAQKKANDGKIKTLVAQTKEDLEEKIKK